MRRRFLSTWVVLALVLAAALVAGCGSSADTGTSTGAATTPAAQSSLSAEQIVTQSMAAMDKTTSGSFTADVSLAVKGDPAKISDPTAKQLVQSPITLHVEGKSSDKPTAATMDMTIGVMGQNIDMSILASGKKAWVNYDGTWYAVPQENTKALGEQQSSGALPTDELSKLGIDPKDWNVQWELVETKQVDGVECYHVTAQPDVAKMTDSLMKALENPKLLNELGGDQAQQLQQLQQQRDPQQLKELKDSLKGVGLDLWIETGTMYLRQGALTATMDMTKMKDAQGVQSASIEVGFTMSDFNEPVKVTPPAKAKKLDQLMQGLMGGMMGAAGSTSGFTF